MKQKILTFFILLHSCIAIGQNRNAVWCFGDSAGIDFSNVNNPVPFSSGMDARGSCASISDSSGTLQFYASTSDIAVIPYNQTGIVRNQLHQVMSNGDTIVAGNWYLELAITDNPGSQGEFYLFSIGVTVNDGFYYSVVDMNQNGGLGAVTQKNIQLQYFPCSDGLVAIKHANGRDWWVLFKKWATPSNQYYKYLITPSGISNVIIQNIGSSTNNGFSRIVFSKDGTKMVLMNYPGLLEIYDFDRCTGLISNPVTIHTEPTNYPIRNFWSCEFSPNGRFLYVTAYSDTCYLYQYDLLSSNPANSRVMINTFSSNFIGIGFLKRAPDNKIYLSTAWQCAAFPDCYPYPDSVYNQINMNLSVINSPDSLGLACNYTPYSFYLGGKRTYYGLPNNPDYDLPALAGSPCDTLVSLNEPVNVSTNPNLHVYYAPEWEKAFINADKLKGKNYRLRMVDVLGKEVYTESGVLNSQYFTRDLNCTSFASGIYLITFETEKERLVKKMQVNWR
ncbi:MAG TPA: hypothetical protein PKD91_05520 [Bacteroidia bacterium]|nr:hypothetical protein [Bacteroidia bacterium]